MNAQFQSENKVAVCISEMARMIGLSRARFYQLIGSAFPFPLYNVSTKRPFFDEELQRVCLEVRRKNCGIDGKPILFYAARGSTPARPRTVKGAPPKSDQYADLLNALKALGLASVTAGQVAQVVKQLFPAGTTNTDQAEVVRAVFIHLKRKNSSDNVG
jgi:hypothetical protein